MFLSFVDVLLIPDSEAICLALDVGSSAFLLEYRSHYVHLTAFYLDYNVDNLHTALFIANNSPNGRLI